jgi:hypothetical protein
MIKLNLLGTFFEIPKEILIKAEFFANMLGDIEYDGTQIIINRSPKLFNHVLAYLIDDKYPYPEKYVNELNYYLVNYGELYNPIH